MMHKYLIAYCLVLLQAITVSAQQKTTPVVLIRAEKFYDAEKNVFLKNQEVLVEGNKIKAVGPRLTVPAGARVINMPAATITPGLIDAHTHLLMLQKGNDNLANDVLLNSSERRVLRAAGYAQSYLEAGFTAIRDLGNSGQYLDVEVAVAINRGYIPGPRMLVSGPILSAMDGQFYQLPLKEHDKITQSEYRVIKGVDDAVLAVKEHANNMVDVIKIVAWGERMGLETAEMKAIVETAHKLGIKVTAHATGGDVIRRAVEAGVDGIEHAYYIEDSVLDLMAKKGVYMVPTDPSLHDLVSKMEAIHEPKIDTPAIRQMLQPLSVRLKKAKEKDVLIVNGSDAYTDLRSTRGNAAKESLVAYHEEGLPVADVMRTATRHAAMALGRAHDFGTLQAGMKADLVVFNGDLEADFAKVLFEVKLVMKDGKIVYQP